MFNMAYSQESAHRMVDPSDLNAREKQQICIEMNTYSTLNVCCILTHPSPFYGGYVVYEWKKLAFNS